MMFWLMLHDTFTDGMLKSVGWGIKKKYDKKIRKKGGISQG